MKVFDTKDDMVARDYGKSKIQIEACLPSARRL